MEVSKDALLLSGVCDSSTVYQVCMLCLHVRECGGGWCGHHLCPVSAGTDFRLPATHREDGRGGTC